MSGKVALKFGNAVFFKKTLFRALDAKNIEMFVPGKETDENGNKKQVSAKQTATGRGGSDMEVGRGGDIRTRSVF